MTMVLASASPRRAALLRDAGIAHVVVPTHVDETPPAGATPREAAEAIARRKCLAAKGDLVLAADTLLDLDGRVLGKPTDDADARRILRALSGRAHLVHTGVAVRAGARIVADVATTRVVFRPLGEAEIAAYVATGEPRDKAGAYAVQGGARMFVASLDGPLDNVIGLPMGLVQRLLDDAGAP